MSNIKKYLSVALCLTILLCSVSWDVRAADAKPQPAAETEAAQTGPEETSPAEPAVPQAEETQSESAPEPEAQTSSAGQEEPEAESAAQDTSENGTAEQAPGSTPETPAPSPEAEDIAPFGVGYSGTASVPVLLNATQTSLTFKTQLKLTNSVINEGNIPNFIFTPDGTTGINLDTSQTGSLVLTGTSGTTKSYDYTGTISAGIMPNTRYRVYTWVRIRKVDDYNATELVKSAEMLTSTLPQVPTIQATPNIANKTVTVSGAYYVNTNGNAPPTSASITWGTDPDFTDGTTVNLSPGSSGNYYNSSGFSCTLTGLPTNRTCYVKTRVSTADATWGGGEAVSETKAFQLRAAPTATVPAASNVLQNSADISGTYNPKGLTISKMVLRYRVTGTSAWKEQAVSYPQATGTVDKNYSTSLTGLAANSKYEMLLVITDQSGETTTSPTTFITLPELLDKDWKVLPSYSTKTAVFTGSPTRGTEDITGVKVTFIVTGENLGGGGSQDHPEVVDLQKGTSGDNYFNNNSFYFKMPMQYGGYYKYNYAVKITVTNAAGSMTTEYRWFHMGTHVIVEFVSGLNLDTLHAYMSYPTYSSAEEGDFEIPVPNIDGWKAVDYDWHTQSASDPTIRSNLAEIPKLNLYQTDVMIRVFYYPATINVTVPVNMNFSATEKGNGAVVSPEYTFYNNSYLRVKATFEKMNTVQGDGIQFVSNVTGDSQLQLGLSLPPGSDSAFSAVPVITPNISQNVNIGMLGGHTEGSYSASYPDRRPREVKFTVSGRYRGSFPQTPKKPKVEFIFRFELE